MASSGSSPIKIIVTLAVVGAAGTAAFFYYQRSKEEAKAPEFTTTTVARGDIIQVITATGQLDAVLSVDVGSQISGLIVKLHADFNTVVKKDMIIAEIDPATYRQRLRQAEADLASTQASNRLQKLNTERIRELNDKALVTKQELDQAEALLAQSAAQLLTREAAVENANVDLARCTIRSPIDGVVISKQTEEGKTVAASLNAPTLFTIANDLAKMQITAAVAEADIGTVQVGQAVTFTADAYPNRNFQGTVTQVRNAPKMASNVVSYDTIISVENRDLKLRPGMTANVSIVVAKREKTLRIPNATLRVRMPEGLIPEKPATAEAGKPAAPSAGAPVVAENRPRESGGGQGGGERRASGGGGEGGGRRGGGMFGGDASPEQREKMRAVMAEIGITNFREATPEQREQLRKLLTERGLIPAAAAPGEPVITTRTVYRLPAGSKTSTPEAVSIKVGITDGSASEIISGVAEGDVLITSVNVPGGTAANPAQQRANNPFSGGGRRGF